jgi:hypothetical protein
MGLSQLIKYTAKYPKSQTEFEEGVVLEQASILTGPLVILLVVSCC